MKRKQKRSESSSVWASPETILQALQRDPAALRDEFDHTNTDHQEALLELPDGKLADLLVVLGGPAGMRRTFPNAVAVLAQAWAMGGRPRDALKLFDALVDVDHQELGAYGVALWAVQDDNTHLGIDEPRARRYVERCVAHGKGLADIHFNAMFVLLEIGDVDGALAQLKAALEGGFSRDAARASFDAERLCEGVRGDERFRAALGL